MGAALAVQGGLCNMVNGHNRLAFHNNIMMSPIDRIGAERQSVSRPELLSPEGGQRWLNCAAR